MLRTQLRAAQRRAHSIAVRVLLHISAVGLAALTSSSTPLAYAQDDDAVTAAARALAIDGVKLAQSDQCSAAIDKLERAEALHHAPIVLEHLGACYIAVGRLVEGSERLRQVLREPLPAKPSAALAQAYADAKRLLEATKPKLASLVIEVQAPTAADPTVRLDGSPIPAALLGVPRPTDPGGHVVEASAPGYSNVSRQMSLEPGETQSLTLELTAEPDQHTQAKPDNPPRSSVTFSAAAAAPVQPTAAPAQQSTGARLLPAIVAWGAGVAALGVGVGFGIAAMHDASQLKTLCPDKRCSASHRDVLDTGRTNAALSTAGYAVALAAAAAGTVLYFTLARPERPTRPRLKASLGVGAAAVSGTF